MSEQMLTEEQIITIKKAAIATDPGKPWGDSIAFARAIESAVRAELMRGEFICHKCGIRQDAPKPDVAPF